VFKFLLHKIPALIPHYILIIDLFILFIINSLLVYVFKINIDTFPIYINLGGLFLSLFLTQIIIRTLKLLMR